MFWKRKKNEPKALIVTYPGLYPDEFRECQVRDICGYLFYSLYGEEWKRVKPPFYPVNFNLEDVPLSEEGRAALEATNAR
jgi:hypothetical protein